MNDRSLASPDMNATPLIDVLLVLLVILIFTLPIATHATKLTLPRGISLLPSPSVTVDIDFDGALFWDGERVTDLRALEARFRAVGAQERQPRIKVVPDKRVRFESVGQVLAAAQRCGITKLSVQ
jgi:biopolymer transport protein ExbD